MLNLIVGKNKEYANAPDGWFDNQLDDDYLNTDFSKDAVLKVDKSELVNENLVQSPFLGAIPPSKLSRGVKTIILLRYVDDRIFDLDYCGDNCTALLASVFNQFDRTAQANVFQFFYKNGLVGKIHIMNDDSYVSSDLELFDKFQEFGV